MTLITCYYCGSEAHDDTPCPHRKEDAERFAKAGQAIYPKLTKQHAHRTRKTSGPSSGDEEADR